MPNDTLVQRMVDEWVGQYTPERWAAMSPGVQSYIRRAAAYWAGYYLAREVSGDFS